MLGTHRIKTKGENMTVVTELANGTTEVFKTDNYAISRPRDFHPLILTVTVYDNGRKVKSAKRPCKWFYKHFTFKSEKVQKELTRIEAEHKITQKESE